MYSLDDQDCIKFGGALFICKMVDNIAQKIQSPCLYLDKTRTDNTNLTVYSVPRLLFGIFSLNLFYRLLSIKFNP